MLSLETASAKHHDFDFDSNSERALRHSSSRQLNDFNIAQLQLQYA